MRPQFRFDDVELDLEAFRLTRAGRRVHLEPKVLELLGYLVQNRGRLVEKAELQAALWRDTAVSESALTRAVAQLRKALEDDAREARYVETVPTRGYRFKSEVRVEQGRNGSPPVDAAESAAGDGQDSRWRRSAAPGRWLAVTAALGLLAALVATALRPRPPLQATRTAPREVQRTLVSTSRGFNSFPAFSPDGSTLAFSSDRSGRLEIYLRALAPGAREMPVTSDGQDNVQPAWSPDGRHLAYHSMRRGGIWLVPALGGAARQLSAFGSAPAWSPDGRRIAFSSLGVAALEGVVQFSASLWTVGVADGPSAEPRPLSDPGNPPSGHGPPLFTPDGRQVLFVADGIWAVGTDGARAPRSVVAASSVTDIALSADGRTLYWTGWERGNWRIWSAPLPDAPEPAGARVEVLNTGDLAARHLAVSRQGRLACGLVSLTSELALVRLTAEGSPAGPATEPWPGATGRKVQLHFSPDGTTLAFARQQPGQGVEIWGLDVSSGAARALLPGADAGFLNGWFPRGDALLLTSRSGTARSLLRAPLTGSRPEPLRPSAGVAWARLMGTGREVVFHAVTGGTLNVHRSDLDGSHERPLTADAQGVGWPVPSPVGRTLAVEMFRGNDTQVGLLSADDGGVPRPLTRVPGQHWVHDWSPDGRRVLYAARRDGLWNVYWMDIHSGEERRLSDLGRVRDAVRTPSWSPAGDRVAYERTEATGAVWVLDLTPTPAP